MMNIYFPIQGKTRKDVSKYNQYLFGEQVSEQTHVIIAWSQNNQVLNESKILRSPYSFVN